MSFPNVMTQLWYYTIEGIPNRLKNTRRMDLEKAIKSWTELISTEWELGEYQIKKNVA